MFKINNLHNDFFNMELKITSRNTVSKSIEKFFVMWNFDTADEKSSEHHDRETIRTAFNSENVDLPLHLILGVLLQFMTDFVMNPRPARKRKKQQNAPHSVNQSRTPRPWIPNKWRRNSLQKVAKTHKSKTTKAKQQQHREKNDFYAWKVPLSPLASHQL